MKIRILVLSIIATIVLNANDTIVPLPTDFKYDKEKALLGKKLFYDTLLSGNNTISCASCHILEDGGDDNLQYSFGIDGKVGNINSPTVLNARYHLSQFWDGSAKNLKEQARGPIHNPIEMGSSMDEVVRKLQLNTNYISHFNKIYKDGLTKNNILDAIAEFEKALVTPNSKFDKYLKGDQNSLTKNEKDGFALFKENGCISCHNGINIGSNLYQKIGILKTYIGENNIQGRYNVTLKDKDRYFFKVPTLRNIALTAPYLHDGSKDSLKAVVKFMMMYQLGIVPKEEEIDKIVLFLKTLTGDIPKILESQ